MTEPLSHSKPARLAGAALHAAMSDNWDAATRYVARISSECGGEGLGIALRGWCDTYHDHATNGDMSPNIGRMAFIREDTGGLNHTGDEALPPEVDWAGRLIHARCAMDHDRYQELIGEIPDDGLVIGRYVGRLLGIVAGTINGLPRGFARMGRAS